MIEWLNRSLRGVIREDDAKASVLRRVISKTFSVDTAGHLSALLDDLSGSEDIDRVTDPLIECATEQEFIEGMQVA